MNHSRKVKLCRALSITNEAGEVEKLPEGSIVLLDPQTMTIRFAGYFIPLEDADWEPLTRSPYSG